MLMFPTKLLLYYMYLDLLKFSFYHSIYEGKKDPLQWIVEIYN